MQYGRLFSCKPSKPLANTLMQWIGAQEYIYNSKVGEDRYYRTYARKYMPIGTFPEVNQQYSQFKGEDNQWLKTIPSQVLRNGATKWAQSYQRFFAKLGGRPKIQKKGNGRRSVWLTRELFRFVECINSDGVITHHIQIGTQSKPLGYLPFVAHTTYTMPNSIHISIRGGKWFVSFNNDDGNQEPTDEEIASHLKTFTREELLAKSIGIDRGVVLPFAKSDSTSGGFSLIQKQRIAKAEQQKKWWQRIQARRTKKSHRWKRACAKVARYQQYGVNVRKDVAHKESYGLANSDAVLFGIENLQIANMTKSAKGTIDAPGKKVKQKAGLNRAILGSAWGMFSTYLQYKARRKGKLVVKVPAAFSSQECAPCGHTHKDNRVSQSLFVCQACGFSANADFNAASIIAKRAVDVVLSEAFNGKKQKKSISRKKVGQVMSELLSETSTISQEMTHGEIVSVIDSQWLFMQPSLSRETPAITANAV